MIEIGLVNVRVDLQKIADRDPSDTEDTAHLRLAFTDPQSGLMVTCILSDKAARSLVDGFQKAIEEVVSGVAVVRAMPNELNRASRRAADRAMRRNGD